MNYTNVCGIVQHLLTVVPVIGLVSRIEDFKPLLNTDEVDAIFDVPLEMFLKVMLIPIELTKNIYICT